MQLLLKIFNKIVAVVFDCKIDLIANFKNLTDIESTDFKNLTDIKNLIDLNTEH